LTRATEFFVELGLVLQGEAPVEGRSVDRVVGRGRTGGGCDDADSGRQRTTLAGEVPLAVTPGRQPARAGETNTPGIRHVAFAVEDIDVVVARLRARGAGLVGALERYEDSYRLCYVRGPEGIIIELAEQIG
jgi:catechol 2,3-dioxygenase-like lactoylglutathione lyase family enzyme